MEVFASSTMALVGVELETLVSETDALTTRPPPCAHFCLQLLFDHNLLRADDQNNTDFNLL